jgi:hypothetical protein
MLDYKIVSALGAIRLLRRDSSYRLIRVGENLEEGDLIEVLSPISSITIKSSDGVKSYEGIHKFKIQDGKLLDVTAQSIKEKPKEQIVEDEKVFEFIESIPFDIQLYLKTRLTPLDVEHIVDHKVLLFDISRYAQFYLDGVKLEPDEGCLMLNTTDNVEIKKFDNKISFIISAYILHESKVSKYASFPKSYKFVKFDDDGLKVIKREESVEYTIEL